MGWNSKRYSATLISIQEGIDKGYKSPADYMTEYKRCIELEDYEQAKAITEVLRPLNYYTEDTHPHIDCLWN